MIQLAEAPAKTVASHNLEAEVSVLGACLQDAEAARKATEILRVSDFFQTAHGEIFGVVQFLVARGTPPDLVTAAQELTRRQRLEAIGGGLYLYDLVEECPTTANVGAHARIVKEKSNRRRMIAACTEAAEKARGGGEIGELLPGLREELNSLSVIEDGRRFLVRALDLTAEPVSFTVDTMLPKGMLALLSGKDKRGKTLFAQEKVRAVLTRSFFLDRFPTESGPVVCAFLDDPPGLTRERLKALGILEHPGLWLVDPLMFDGDAMRFLDRLEAEAAKVRPALVVVDSFYQLVPHGREAGNDQSRMAPLMARLNRLAETTGAAVEVVAHDNKSGADVAGSHVIRARAKCIMRLTLPRGGEPEDPDEAPATPRRVLTVESKFGVATSWALEVQGVGAWRCFGSPQDLRSADTLMAVQAFLASGKAGTAEEIAEEVKKRLEDVTRTLRVLVDAGKALEEPRKKERGRPATVYRGQDFPTGPDIHSEAREGNSDPQLFDFPKVMATGDLPSRFPTPRETKREGYGEATAEVELRPPLQC